MRYPSVAETPEVDIITNGRFTEQSMRHIFISTIVAPAHKSKQITNQISPTYVIIGASINPTPSPSKDKPIKMCGSVVAKYNTNQPTKFGIFTNNIALFRPIGSVIGPERRLPTMVSIDIILPSQDACAPVIRIVSLGFVSELRSVSAGLKEY